MNDCLMSTRSRPIDVMATGLTTREGSLGHTGWLLRSLRRIQAFSSLGNRIPSCQGQQMRDRRVHCVSIAHKSVTVFIIFLYSALISFFFFWIFMRQNLVNTQYTSANTKQTIYDPMLGLQHFPLPCGRSRSISVAFCISWTSQKRWKDFSPR